MSNGGAPWTNPIWVFALCVGAAVILWAAIVGVGEAIAAISHGPTTGFIATWVVPAGVVGGSAMLAGGGALTATKAGKSIAAKPVYPTIALFALAQSFLLDLYKEIWPGTGIEKVCIKGLCTLVFAVASALWLMKDWRLRVGGTMLFLTLPTAILKVALAPH